MHNLWRLNYRLPFTKNNLKKTNAAVVVQMVYQSAVAVEGVKIIRLQGKTS